MAPESAEADLRFKGGRERLGVNVTNPSERGKHDQACLKGSYCCAKLGMGISYSNSESFARAHCLVLSVPKKKDNFFN